VEFELQFAQGDAIQGPYDRYTLRQMVYTGRLAGDERIRPPGGDFCALKERPEFAVVLDSQRGVRRPSMRPPGKARPTATKKTVSAPKVRRRPAPAEAAEPAESLAPDPEAASPDRAIPTERPRDPSARPPTGFLSRPSNSRIILVTVITVLASALLLLIAFSVVML